MSSDAFLEDDQARTAGPSREIHPIASRISGSNFGSRIMNDLTRSMIVDPPALTAAEPVAPMKSRNPLNADEFTRELNWAPRDAMTGATFAMMGPRADVRSVTDFSHGCSAPATTGVCAAFTLSHASAMSPSCLDRAICAGDMPAYALAMASCSALYALAGVTPFAMAML